MLGARAAGTSTPLSERGAHAHVGDLFAAVAAHGQQFDFRAHFVQRGEQTGTQRIGHHPFDDDLGARHDQCGDQRETPPMTGSAGTTTSAGTSSG